MTPFNCNYLNSSTFEPLRANEKDDLFQVLPEDFPNLEKLCAYNLLHAMEAMRHNRAMIWWPSEIPTLQYGLVTLRRPAESDVPKIYEACQDPLIPRFTTVPAEYTMAHALDYVQRIPASLELRREFPFLIEFGVGDEKEFAGVISLHTISLDNHRAEIGYWMHAPMRGKGIGTIAAKMITNYGLLTMGFLRIEAAVDVDNAASQKLLMSAGYNKEGILRQRITRSNGSQIDMVELAVLASEWEELK